MEEDASLDQFVGGSGDGDDASDASDSETTPPEAERASGDGDTETETTADGPTPATTTYAWSDEGTQCAACDEVVERRWQQDGALVCVECKEWDRA